MKRPVAERFWEKVATRRAPAGGIREALAGGQLHARRAWLPAGRRLAACTDTRAVAELLHEHVLPDMTRWTGRCSAAWAASARACCI
ncbi:hypothetical protein DS6A_46 [Mycobacterium phage DS6A]|uniref:Uncharacterized protein n=1 Tax=Mycobacterium phage DS6A TaxID=45764 RepID=G8I4F6_9CAUD|nr:hypothetical protein DS6A_46 [Mycobacterium phage DS6A]AER47600.1 hypothetical protein DS6A_46 [Mycobacterium phage DS6A]